MGAEIAVWREESAGIDDGIVLNQASRMFNAMRESVRTSLPDSSTTGVFKIISAGQPRNDQEKQTRPRFNKKSSSIEIILKEKRFDAKGQSRYFFRERVVDILF